MSAKKNKVSFFKKIKPFNFLIPVGFLSAALFFYTNTTVSSELTLQEIVQESRNVQLKIANTSLSQEARNFLISHKKVISNYLASKTLSKTCADLLSHDDSLMTGRYVLYPTGEKLKPSLFRCEIRQKLLASETLIRPMNAKFFKKPLLSAGRRFNKVVTLNFASAGPNRVDLKGVRGMPKIVEKLSSAPCKMNVDYGFDENGIWVKNNCSATFKVPMIMPLPDRTITSRAENPNPIIGRMNLPAFEGDNVAITGWACEKDKPTTLNVQLYMGGPAGIGTLVASKLVNLETNDTINAKCDTLGAGIGTAHGYKFLIPASKLDFRRLYVHAVSSSLLGTSNGSLKGSRARIIPPAPKAFPGAHHCDTFGCSFEDPRDTSPAPVWNRYLINNDQASIDQRCIELGYAYGKAIEFYTYTEWCRYSNARTKYWDGVKWVLGSCRSYNVKRATCH